MHPSAASMPSMGNPPRRDKSQNDTLRVRSQPASGFRSMSLSPPISPSASPMKNFIGNLLHLTPHRHASPFNTSANRSKISSSLSTHISNDRSSRIKLGHPSLVSSFSIRSTTMHSPRENRVNLLGYFVFFDNILSVDFSADSIEINSEIPTSRKSDSIRYLLV